MTTNEQIEKLKQESNKLLRTALNCQAVDKGGFSFAQTEAWIAYDNSLAELSKLMLSKN